jgi:hypothetical protein
MKERWRPSAITALQNVTPLLPVGPLQRPLNRGHGVRRVDDGEGTQGEAVRHEAGEDVAAPLAAPRPLPEKRFNALHTISDTRLGPTRTR